LSLAGTIALLSFVLTGGTCFHGVDQSHELRNTLLTPAIEMRADEANLEDLRTKTMKPGNLEIRIWIEPMLSVSAAEGYVLERVDSLWTGKHLLPRETKPAVVQLEHGVVLTPPSRFRGSTSIQPLNGWDFLWNSLTNAGLLSVPDESQLDLRASKLTEEGSIYVVETKTSNVYRTYRYTRPEQFNLPETNAMVRFIQILRDEFPQDQLE
jgi:hypothetical protein